MESWHDQSQSSRLALDRHSSTCGLSIAHSLEAGEQWEYTVGYRPAMFSAYNH